MQFVVACKYRVIIWECTFNKHLVRICIDRHRNIIHRSNTQGGSFYLWYKLIRYLEWLTCMTWSKLHPALRTGAARLDVWRVWLFSRDQTMLLIKDLYRRLEICSAIDLHSMCLYELRNKGIEVKHREGCAAGRPCSCSRFQSWCGRQSDMRICTVFH